MCSALRTGGAERQWSILLPCLARHGFTVELITLEGKGRFYDEIQQRGVHASCAGLRNRYDIQGVARIVRSLAQRPALVVSQETNAHVIGQAVARRFDAGHIAIDHTPPGLARAAHRRLLTRLVARRVDRAVGVSRAQLPDLVQAGFLRTRIRIINNGVPPLEPTQDRKTTRAALGFDDRDFVALLVATLRPQKRAAFFIEAVSLANQMNPRVHGLIAGGGPDFASVAAKAKEHGGVVRMLGDREDVANLVAASDALCLTSWTEGLPMVLLEAMSLGATIVATDVPGNREVVEHEQTGLLSSPQDAGAFAASLIRLSDDPALDQRLGNAARERYEQRFTARRMISEYVSLFSSVIAERETSPQ
jgi:glycosyltransferase involved in cell wall biosynthesis